MESCLEAPPPTPATPCAPDASSPQRSAERSFDAAVGASVPPTPQHPTQLFAAAPRIYIGMLVSPIGPARLPLGCPHRDYGSLLRPPKGFRRSGPHTDRARRSCAMRFTRIICLNLSFSFHGSAQDFYISFIWRALLCLEGLMSMRVFARGGPVPHPLSPLPGCA